MVDKDWTGNSVAFAKTLGASNHALHEREANDYYATEPRAVELLLGLETFDGGKIWECACGSGHLSRYIERLGFDVRSTDLIDRGFGESGIDFLALPADYANDRHIITNPPYKYANDFILQGLRLLPENGKLALFMPIRYLSSKGRKKIFEAHPPFKVWISASRLKCAKNGSFETMKGSAVDYAWFVWQKDYTGKAILGWFN